MPIAQTGEPTSIRLLKLESETITFIYSAYNDKIHRGGKGLDIKVSERSKSSKCASSKLGGKKGNLGI